MASKIPLLFLPVAVILAGGGTYYWLSHRETASDGQRYLAEQNIDMTEDNFLAEIKAQHLDSIHAFLLAGGQPNTVDANGISALMAGVQTGNKQIVEMLLSALSINPSEAAQTLNMQDTANQKTALVFAVEKGDADIVSLLLARGADTGITDKNAQTPLIVAVRHKSPALMTLLINADLKLHQGLSINTSDAGGETPLTYAIRQQDPDMVAALLKVKADAALADHSGVTPLMVAGETGNDAIAGQLIAAGAKLDVADRQGNTPLLIAIRHAHPTMAQLLLDKGANPDFHTSGPLPLQAAISMEPFDEKLFAFLQSHSKEQGNIDASMVFDAINHKNADLAKALLEHVADVKTLNTKGETLLYHAVENELQDVALALIAKGADSQKTGIPGMSVLERATKHNEPQVVQKLLALGVSPDQKTTEGYTLAEMAVYSGYPEILDALLAKGAKIEKDFGVLWSIRDGKGKSVPVLLKYGAKPTVMSNTGDPALWLAASAGETEAVDALIKSHALLDAPNAAQGMTPLAIASHNGQTDVVKLLVESGAKIEAADSFGMTPLAHAAYMTKGDVVEYLVGMGANVRAADKQGRSVSDLATLGEASSARDRIITILQK